MHRIICITCVILLVTLHGLATSWNEPWHDEVVRLADLFVRVKIESTSDSRTVAKVVKVLGGEESRPTIVIEGYSHLRISSMSGGHNHELELPFKTGNEYYLLVKRNAAGNYQLPTPTSGWAYLENETVYATYRHSYHKALVPVGAYELTMGGIFGSAKGGKLDPAVSEFVREQINKAPAGLGDLAAPETKLFFLQHAALETLYHTRMTAELASLEPFLVSPEYHVQISAVRAAGRIRSPVAQERLMKFVEGKATGFAKVMGIWALRDQDARRLIPRFEALIKTGSNDETGFGGSIMDPRIATVFPESVKAAATEVVVLWKGKSNKP